VSAAPAPEPSAEEIERVLRRSALRFRRVCLEKVWGGRKLEDVLGIRLERPGPIGETWELVDRADQQSIVDGGELAGATLGHLVRAAGASLLGDAARARDGRFPLLVKYLDATEPLSIQVHPDDEGARRQGGDSEAKTEAWYFLRDGGEVWCGFEPGTDRPTFEETLAAGQATRCLVRHPVRGGTALTVRGGTVHAIGGGVTLLEVQQNSDTTYRLDDWGRLGLDGKPRDLHVARGLEVVHFGVPSPRATGGSGARGEGAVARELLARTEHFEMEALCVAAEGLELTTQGRFQVYVCVAGSAILFAPRKAGAMRLATGDLVLVPAVLGAHRLGCDPQSATETRIVRLAPPSVRRP
jgi:mannose-6-phosphate isomerase